MNISSNNYKQKYLKYKKKYLELKGGKDINNNDISILFINIFSYLKKYNICFINGSYIFEDNDMQLFNLLTFNKSYVTYKTCPLMVSKTHWTTTHKNFQSNENILNLPNINCINHNNLSPNLFKLERILEPNINFICDQDTQIDQRNPNNAETKKIILYYPFIHNKINKKYLFVKFESHPMESIGHVVNFLNTKRNTTYPIRREDKESNRISYFKDFYEKDKQFYTDHYKYIGNIGNISHIEQSEIDSIIKNEIDNLDTYNKNIRTGNELYITNNMLSYYLETYLTINKPITKQKKFML
jgi:hypothetical protein